MRTAVVGLGNMGTALAHLLADNGHDVAGWDALPGVREEVRLHHRNERFLPGVPLPDRITAAPSLEGALTGAELAVLALPSRFLEKALKEMAPHLPAGTVVVGAAKGLDPKRGLTPSLLFTETTGLPLERYVALSGPSIANEFARRRFCVVTLASAGPASLAMASEALANDYFRVELSADLAGVEWGGILKNLYALGMGVLDGLDPGAVNLKAAFVSAALREMKSLALGFGAEPKTLDGFAGLGDLVTTGFSPASHNRRLGEALGRGASREEALQKLGGSEPEGVGALAQVRARVGPGAMPLAECLHRFLDEHGDPARFRDEVQKTLTRS